ncbi:MAG: hypothetical protein K1X75_01090 [Leptospirales bacterium]|nr:hypothetical protein [Leptospirales bacterium]
MKYGKIRGRDVSECLMKLRSQHGENAIVVQTRAVKGDGLFGAGIFGKKEYEIDYMVAEERSPGRSALASRLNDRAALTSPERNRQRREWIDRTLRQTAGEGDPLPARFPRLGEASVDQSAPRHRSASDDAVKPVLDAGDRAAIDMLLQGWEGAGPDVPARPLSSPEPMVSDEPSGPAISRRRADAAAPRIERPIFAAEPEEEDSSSERSAMHFNRLRARLGAQGFSEDFCRRFLRKLDKALSAEEKEDLRIIENRAIARLADLIHINSEIAPPRGECRAIFFIGPAGAGKTTSLAKVAARYHIVKQRDVSLYSLDHYRLAATEQLKTYASVMEAPFFAPFSPGEFRECLRRDGAELMLIDTSGIGARDHERLNALRQYMEACEVRCERHLVLAADLSPEAMEKIMLACDRIGADKIVVTKMDETEKIGPLVELADKYNKPFSFFMNGQDVPADILDLRPEELAQRLIQEEGATAARVPVAQDH